MAISRREALKRGISYGTGVINHGNDSIAYDRALKTFPADDSYAALRAAIAEGDAESALPAAQAFRKRCGELALSELYLRAAAVVAALEEGSLPPVEELDALDAARAGIVAYLERA